MNSLSVKAKFQKGHFKMLKNKYFARLKANLTNIGGISVTGNQNVKAHNQEIF